MRTTIEMTSRHRSALLRLAGERGEKGFSLIVAEAIEAYLASVGRADDRDDAVRLKGILTGADADALRKRVGAIHESWR